MAPSSAAAPPPKAVDTFCLPALPPLITDSVASPSCLPAPACAQCQREGRKEEEGKRRKRGKERKKRRGEADMLVCCYFGED